MKKLRLKPKRYATSLPGLETPQYLLHAIRLIRNDGVHTPVNKASDLSGLIDCPGNHFKAQCMGRLYSSRANQIAAYGCHIRADQASLLHGIPALHECPCLYFCWPSSVACDQFVIEGQNEELPSVVRGRKVSHNPVHIVDWNPGVRFDFEHDLEHPISNLLNYLGESRYRLAPETGIEPATCVTGLDLCSTQVVSTPPFPLVVRLTSES